MAITLPSGIYWPYGERRIFATSGSTVDAAAEYVACIGNIFFEDRASGSKTLDTTGSSGMHWWCVSRTWATSGSTLKIGFKDIDNTTGPPIRPGSTWHVYDEIVQGTDTLTAATARIDVPSSGTLSVSHGDLVCFVIEMTVKNGSDAVQIMQQQATAGTTTYMRPAGTASLGAGVTATLPPAFMVTFSDGTIGWIDGLFTPGGVTIAQNYNDSSNPDEYGMIFQVPFATTADGMWIQIRTVAGSNGTVILYSDPTGTPTALDTVTFTPEDLAGTGSSSLAFFPISRSLSANTDYCVAMKATTANNLRMDGFSLFGTTGADVIRKVWPAGTTMLGASRQNSSGAFSTSSTTIWPCGVRIKEIPSGGGMIRQVGMNGGMAG